MHGRDGNASSSKNILVGSQPSDGDKLVKCAKSPVLTRAITTIVSQYIETKKNC